jgi:hypothetical protein
MSEESRVLSTLEVFNDLRHLQSIFTFSSSVTISATFLDKEVVETPNFGAVPKIVLQGEI